MTTPIKSPMYAEVLAGANLQFTTSQRDLTETVNQLESKIDALNQGPKTQGDALDKLIDEMLGYYKAKIPTIMATHIAGKEAIANIKKAFDYIQPQLTDRIFADLSRTGCKNEDLDKLQTTQKELVEEKPKLTGLILTLEKLTEDLETVRKSFKHSLDGALKLQGIGKTNTLADYAKEYAISYVFLNKKLAEQNTNQEPASLAVSSH